MANRVEDKVALITGAGSGIGRATAQLFAREGASVVVSDIDIDGGLETVALIQEDGGHATFVECDVTSASDVEATVRKTVDVYGRLDCAFNNAGFEGDLAPVAEYSEDGWAKVIDVNLTGVWLCMKFEIEHMLTRGSGSIVNAASVLGVTAFADFGPYTAAKHGVVGLTKAAAIGYATNAIRVNALCPGFVETAMVTERGVRAASGSEAHRKIAESHPVKRLGQPEEIAEAALWLSTDSASFVTGHALLADGGYTAQ